jgi:hypothetical protein
MQEPQSLKGTNSDALPTRPPSGYRHRTAGKSRLLWKGRMSTACTDLPTIPFGLTTLRPPQ